MAVELTDVVWALEHDELAPCFQPIVCLCTGRLAGFEVLARWQSSKHGLILPTNFISLAEENELIGELTRQILGKAFGSASLVPEPLVLAVNVSPIQMVDSSIVNQIRTAAEGSGFPLQRLIIEITESALLNDLAQAQKIAHQLKEMGCKLALDDFGTGYSSLHHLRALPFDELKIDRSFVASMSDTRESRKIVAATVGLGHSLGLITVAEGVETEEQANMLLRLGCELGQGWFYGRPARAERLEAMIAAEPHKLSVPSTAEDSGALVSSLEAMPSQRLAQLEAIYDGAPVGMCFLDRQFRFVSINRLLAGMDGVSVAEHLGRTVKEVIPRFFPTYEPYLLRALHGESIKDVEIQAPALVVGGPVRTTLASYQPAFDEEKEVLGISVVVVDITNRKHAEDELRASEEQYRDMVESNPHVPWIMDAKGNNVDVGSRWAKKTGQSKEQARNRGWLAALHPEDVGPTVKALEEGLRTGKPIDVEYRVKIKGGKWRWMRSRGSPHRGANGEIVRWYGNVEDIDENKRMKAELQKRRKPSGSFKSNNLPISSVKAA